MAEFIILSAHTSYDSNFENVALSLSHILNLSLQSGEIPSEL